LNHTGGVAVPGPILIDGPSVVRLLAPQQLSPQTVVTFDATGGVPVLDLNGRSQTLAGIAVGGSIDPNAFGGAIHLGAGGSLALSASPQFLSQALRQSRIDVTSTGAPKGYAVGVYNSGAAVTLKYALSGDATDDGRVDFSDLLRLAQHYNAPAISWGSGDFNNDGTVNFSDLLTLAQNYGKVVAQPSASLLSPLREAIPASSRLRGCRGR
jgi:hypothetical protein